MRQKKKKRKGKKLVVIIIVLAVLLLVGGAIYLATQQIKLLDGEVGKLLRLDETEGSIDEEIYTNGNYGEVEQTIKDYIGEYRENLLVIKTLFQDQEFSDILSMENMQKDGPAFEKSLKYLDEKADLAKQAFQRLQTMAEEETILAAIEEKSLGSYFEWIYKRLMLERVQTDYMYSAEGLKSAEESVEQTIAERKEILVFLSEHADDWKLDGGKLKFESDALLKQYNQLVNNINQE